MIRVKSFNGALQGITVGLRNNGDRAVLLDSNEVIWYKKADFEAFWNAV